MAASILQKNGDRIDLILSESQVIRFLWVTSHSLVYSLLTDLVKDILQPDSFWNKPALLSYQKLCFLWSMIIITFK